MRPLRNILISQLPVVPSRFRPLLRVIAGGRKDAKSTVPPSVQVTRSGRFAIEHLTKGGPNGPSDRGKKILIIDLSDADSPLAMVTDLAGLLLEKHGNRLYRSHNTQEAAGLFEAKLPHLVVFCAGAPAALGDGFGLVRAIKERAPLTTVMLLLEKTGACLRESPADHLLFNPADPNELELQISNALCRQAEQAEEFKTMEITRRQSMLVAGAASIAHEINNLTQAVSLQLEMIERVTGPLGRSILNIEENLAKSFQALEKVRHFTKSIMELGRGKSARDHFDPNEVIEDAIGMARRKIEEAEIEISTELGAPLPQLFGDKAGLFHAVLNLLYNAKDATPPGGSIKVTSWLEEGEVRISVADTGCGIPRELIPKIFTTFFTTKPREKGTGLGLSVVESVVKELRGQITVRSKEGSGTTFTLILPRPARSA